jgi:hypothetical protein
VPKNIGPVAVDIGCNIGVFITTHHSKFKAIYGFEPVYNTFLKCLENTKDLKNVYVHNLGLSKKT